MVVTGIVLAMHYTPTTAGAFDSVEYLMRDVSYGWLIRYVHTTGASMFFAVVYIHIFRGLYYGSYKAPRELLWWLGIVILLLMMATAFFGYTLPWGQMSFWGATVITNLFSAILGVGDSIVTWLWGGFTVGDPTLNRFYALHYLADCLLLTYAGGQPPEGTWLIMSRIGAAYYFAHFFLVLPLVVRVERPRPLPTSISEPISPATGPAP